ncbi:MAG: penicillin acylase family protein, partial [Kiloniellales bacterium]|nr:penicillin acylase family protein [Kiloniellales bacterium]
GGATFTRDPRKRFSHVHGSGLRALFDLDDLDDSEFIIAIGQSGNPLSRHYGRFAEPWRDGLSLPLDGIGLQRDDRLRLLPKP